MGKGRIAYVVQRYGEDVNGGSEYLCRVLSEHLSGLYDVDVLTSCSRDYSPWDNFYKSGKSELNGVNVYRFPVEQADGYIHEKGEELIWIADKGPYCPGIIEYLKGNAALYKAVLFQTYDFYPSVAGLKLGLENSIFIPTAHDVPAIYQDIYKNTIASAKNFLYQSLEEKDFLEKKFRTSGKPGRTTCIGIDIPTLSDWELPSIYREIGGYNYILYAGRVAHKKNYMQLNRYFIEYKTTHTDDLKLLVIGRINSGMTLLHCDDIIYLGFVPEEDKLRLMRHARFLIMPS